MKIFGLSITRAKAKELQSVDTGRGWHPIIREPYPGAWQRNESESVESVLSYGPVFGCITLIASDIAKCRCRLVSQDSNGIWSETENTAHTPVLRKPNHYQTRLQFFDNWITSKLAAGNAYILKGRDASGIVRTLFVLDPARVRPLIAPNGEVFYQLRRDTLTGTETDSVTVPAREIIHDRFNCLFHPLVGLSPIFAATLPASEGLRIQRTASRFFQNGARPSGVLTAPEEIKPEQADRIKQFWETNFSGDNVARVAVLSDGMTYQAVTMSAVDAQLVAQLKMTGEQVCAVFHVPAYKVGAAAPPSFNNIEALDRAYYSQCLQVLIEAAELCLDEGLALPRPLGTEFDLTDLLRMDAATQIKTEADAVKAGIKSPNEARKVLNLPPTKGGEGPYLQQQNYSLEALAKRDAAEPPPATQQGPPQPPPDDEEGGDEAEAAEAAERALAGLYARLTALEERPAIVDRGVYADGESYAPGDAVTHAGSLWIAQRETDAKPNGPETGWRLAVKRGRDGRDLRE